MVKRLYSYLQHIGVSQKEFDIYTYLLSVDSASPMEIAQQLKIKRSTVYVILDLLKEKGLVRGVQTGKRLGYVAEDPEHIRFLLEKLKLQTEENIKSFDTILPQLKATMRRNGQSPIVKFFEGESAVQASMEELANNPRFRVEMDYGIFPLELVYRLFNSSKLRRYIDLRLTDNKLFQIIYTSDEGIINVAEGQHAFRINSDEFPLSCDISIFEDEVRIHMLGDTIYGILIKNIEFAQTLTSILKLALKNSNKNI
jgi:sugar-specific transcriptional regulator TrmB